MQNYFDQKKSEKNGEKICRLKKFLYLSKIFEQKGKNNV